MLKPITAIIFLLSFALQTFSSWLIVADYFTHTAAYATHCENKAKPQLHCNGKCQMMKKLQHEEQKDEQNNENKSGIKNETILYLQTSFYNISSAYHSTLALYPCISDDQLQTMPRSIFHPPGA